MPTENKNNSITQNIDSTKNIPENEIELSFIEENNKDDTLFGIKFNKKKPKLMSNEIKENKNLENLNETKDTLRCILDAQNNLNYNKHSEINKITINNKNEIKQHIIKKNEEAKNILDPIKIIDDPIRKMNREDILIKTKENKVNSNSVENKIDLVKIKTDSVYKKNIISEIDLILKNNKMSLEIHDLKNEINLKDQKLNILNNTLENYHKKIETIEKHNKFLEDEIEILKNRIKINEIENNTNKQKIIKNKDDVVNFDKMEELKEKEYRLAKLNNKFDSLLKEKNFYKEFYFTYKKNNE